MTIPYIYTLTFIPTGQIYIGSQTRVGCNPKDFWVTYFTSSKEIARLIELNGKSSKVWSWAITQQFNENDCKKQVVKLEHELIKHAVINIGEAGILNNSYNQYGTTVFTVSGRKRPPSECDAISKAQKGRKRTPEQIKKHREKMIGRPLTAEHKRKVSEALIGHSVNESARLAISLSQQKWNNSGATSESTKRWLNAQNIYEAWLSTGFGYARLGKMFNESRQTALQDLVKRFKSGWVPLDDPSWVSFKQSHVVPSLS